VDGLAKGWMDGMKTSKELRFLYRLFLIFRKLFCFANRERAAQIVICPDV
jgi:hypothetical protein